MAKGGKEGRTGRGVRDEDEEARMELTFLSSDGRSRQGMCSLLRQQGTGAPLLVYGFLLIRRVQNSGGGARCLLIKQNRRGIE